MEKLIELLNEWQQSFKPGYEFTYKYSEESAREDLNKLSQLNLFIKRLIDNDKIDVHKIDTIATLHEEGEDVKMILRDSRCSLIMALSISDNPIEDLISYLK